MPNPPPPQKKYYPAPCTYVALRMDPVATVGSVSGVDKEAIDAARAIQPKTYLVYMKQDITLYHPTRPWTCYSVMPVAPSIRRADPANRITPAMCIPIAPNEDHPDGREPVYTDYLFPFDHCYHWDSTALMVRVRPAPGGWDLDEATMLPAEEHMRLLRVLQQDEFEAKPKPKKPWFLRKKYVQIPWNGPWEPPRMCLHPDLLALPPAAADPMIAPPHPMDLFQRVEGGSDDEDSSNEDEDAGGAPPGGSASTANTSVDSLAESLKEHRAVTAINDLRAKAKDTDLLPVVDLWYDLTAHLAEDEIPTPVDFYRERHAIVKIVREARERARNRPEEPVSDEPAESRPAAPAGSKGKNPRAAPEPIKTKPRRLRPLKNLRQLRERVDKVLARASRAMRS